MSQVEGGQHTAQPPHVHGFSEAKAEGNFWSSEVETQELRVRDLLRTQLVWTCS